MAFKPAERNRVFLKVAMDGASGSGKTLSALYLAQGIGKKIALVDTENRSASLYAELVPFETDTIEQPYTVDKYIAKIREAQDAGFDVLVIDSLSHAWAAEGGILDRKAKMDERGGNSFANWNKLTPEQERLKSAILNAKIHIIATMRSKQEYVLEENEKGRQAPKRVGMAPIQRDDLIYEFTTAFSIGPDHVATTSKDRTGLFDKFMEKISPSHGKKLMDWLLSAKPAPEMPPPPTEKPSASIQGMLDKLTEVHAETDVPVDFVPIDAAPTQPKSCAKCGAEMIPHPAGLICSKATDRRDGHSRISRIQKSA